EMASRPLPLGPGPRPRRGGRARLEPIYRKARLSPGLEAADHIGGVEPHRAEGCRREARLVSLVAEQDYAHVTPGKRAVAVRRLRIEAPLEDVARHEGGVRDPSIGLALGVGA